jgi:SAM-dependent methyltransferase
MNEKRIVRTGYDLVSYAYRGDVEDEDCAQYHRWLDKLIPLLPENSPVVDLGCGCGIPVARRLAAIHQVTGIDISPVQIERARHNVPEAQFTCADMARLEFPSESFCAIVSFYAIIHLPLDEQPALFGNLYRWLRPGGYLMATVGSQAWTGREENWLGAGAPMVWSHADTVTYLEWIKAVGFDLLWSRFVPEGGSGHTLILARR